MLNHWQSYFKFKKKAQNIADLGLNKIWQRPTLPHFTAVPLALWGLTSLFGMGRGGHPRYSHLNIFGFGVFFQTYATCLYFLI